MSWEEDHRGPKTIPKKEKIKKSETCHEKFQCPRQLACLYGSWENALLDWLPLFLKERFFRNHMLPFFGEQD